MDIFTDTDLEYMNRVEQEMQDHEQEFDMFECGLTADGHDWMEC